jgi:type II secretory pathway pseudopilin PulG
MVESVTASLAAGIIVAILAVMAIARAVKRRASARDSESQAIAEHADPEERRARRAS